MQLEEIQTPPCLEALCALLSRGFSVLLPLAQMQGLGWGSAGGECCDGLGSVASCCNW